MTSTAEKLRVAFLSGSGHTGTTLLALYMDAHPRIASVGEVAPTRKYQARGADALAAMVCSCGQPYGDCPFWREVFARVTREGIEFSASNWAHDLRYTNTLLHKLLSRYSHRASVRAIQQIARRALPGHRERIARADRAGRLFIQAVLEIAGADVFFDTSKSPMRLQRLLRSPALDLRVVRIARDVRGFASSAKRRGFSVDDAARAWQNRQRIVSGLTAGITPDRVFFLRYEDLCAEPRRWLQALYAFSGVEAIEPPIRVVPSEHHVLGNAIRKRAELVIRAPDRWEDRLTADEISTVLRIAGRMNRELGYES